MRVGLILLCIVGGCRSVDSPSAPEDMTMTIDAASPSDLGVPGRDPKAHPPLIGLTNHGGAPIANMEAWTIVWQGDEARGLEVDRFFRTMLASDYWRELAEYGVGPGKAMGVIVIPHAAPSVIADSDIEPLIKSIAIQPAPNANTFYAFLPPDRTTVISGCGFHSDSSTGVVYSMNKACFNGGFDDLTTTLSHEAAEAATDARPYYDSPGWFADDLFPGALVVEVGDLCNWVSATITSSGDELGPAQNYVVNRIYSNRTAQLGNEDPCRPVPPKEPWFSVAVEPEIIPIQKEATGAGNGQGTFEPFALEEVGNISWRVVCLAPNVFITPTRSSGFAGDTVPFTVTVSPQAPSTIIPCQVIATRASGSVNMWTFGVSVP
jgi:hypothetical protein